MDDETNTGPMTGARSSALADAPVNPWWNEPPQPPWLPQLPWPPPKPPEFQEEYAGKALPEPMAPGPKFDVGPAKALLENMAREPDPGAGPEKSARPTITMMGVGGAGVGAPTL